MSPSRTCYLNEVHKCIWAILLSYDYKSMTSTTRKGSKNLLETISTQHLHTFQLRETGRVGNINSEVG